MKILISTSARTKAWFDKLSKKEQKAYLEAHPHSRHGKGVSAKEKPAAATPRKRKSSTPEGKMATLKAKLDALRAEMREHKSPEQLAKIRERINAIRILISATKNGAPAAKDTKEKKPRAKRKSAGESLLERSGKRRLDPKRPIGSKPAKNGVKGTKRKAPTMPRRARKPTLTVPPDKQSIASLEKEIGKLRETIQKKREFYNSQRGDTPVVGRNKTLTMNELHYYKEKLQQAQAQLRANKKAGNK